MAEDSQSAGGQKLASAQGRGANSYDLVRFLAAAAVLFSHHFALAGFEEPPVPLYGEDFGKLAVEVFFCLSGFLICQSLAKSSDAAEFVSARVLRIFPNLTLALAVSSVFTLLWYGNYDHLWPHLNYVLSNLLMFVRGVAFVIPGIFEDAHNHAVNGPLWSLPIELWSYAFLFLVFALSPRSQGVWIPVCAVALGVVWGSGHLVEGMKLGPLDGFQFFRLASYFFAGATLAVWWQPIKRYAFPLGIVALVLTIGLRELWPANTVFHSLSLALAVVGLGSARKMAWFSKGGDASYGMYIFAWPVQQFCLLLIPGFWLSLVSAFLMTTLIGYATWHSFERRIMTYRFRLAERIKFHLGIKHSLKVSRGDPRG